VSGRYALREQFVATLSVPIPLIHDVRTVGDLLARLGDIPAARVRLHPFPGTATERDLIDVLDQENRTCELVEGTLVEKAMGFRESLLALLLGELLGRFVRANNLGLVAGSDGTLKLFAGLVRAPDVSFVSWKRIPEGKVPSEPIPLLVPDLAIEVLSQGNTRAEMARKRQEYFKAGTILVWMIDPRSRTAVVYRSPDEGHTLNENDRLDGENVLPGFTLPLAELFAELDRKAEQES
jgi:Uma2 family endonuclease